MNQQDSVRVTNLINTARSQGLDVAGVLDTYGLLLTSAQTKRLKLEGLREFRDSVHRWQPHEFARRIRKDAGLTPAEMFDALASYLDDYIALKATEE